jgi:Domain of unknown function (DUF4389)
VLRGEGAWDVNDIPQWRLPYAAETRVGSDAHRDQVMVEFADPVPQNRLTILARSVLALPQLIALWALGVAAEAVLIIGWFGALCTGRLPGFAAAYLSGYLRWQTRVCAYLLLLTGHYPPFSLEDGAYPVRLTVRPGRLNQLAVLFRVVLGIPAMILASLLWFGLCVVTLFVIWLVVLFAGTMPRAAHQALAAVVRYFARFSGYMLLLTGEYPSGLFGDRPARSHRSRPAAGSAAAAGPQWLLVLSDAAKRLVGLFLGVGVAGFAGYVVLIAAIAGGGPAPARAGGDHQVRASYAILSRTLRSLESKTTACTASNDALSCVTGLDRSVAQSLADFESALRSARMPSAAATTAANRLAAATGRAELVFQRLASATTTAAYEQVAAAVNVERIMDQVGMDYVRLGVALSRS